MCQVYSKREPAICAAPNKADWEGRPGRDALTEVPRYIARYAEVERTLQADVLFQISNHVHRRGGFWQPISLGTTEQIHGQRDRARMVDTFLAGGLGLMGLYHLGLFLYRKKDRTALYFGLLSLIITLRLFLTGERLLIETFPWVPWSLFFRLEYLSFYAAFPSVVLFLHALFPAEFSRIILRAVLVCAAPAIAAVIVLPPFYFTYTLPPFQLLSLFTGAYALVALVRAALHRQQGARLILAGWIIFALAITNDILYNEFLIGPGYLVPTGLFFFTFAQAAALSRRIATAFHSSEELSANLERKVEERTSELAKERDRTEKARVAADALRLLAEQARDESDKLLHSILPARFAAELKRDGRVEPLFFDAVSVIFTDFVGFTQISQRMLPHELVQELDGCFSQFDEIVKRNNVEKLSRP